MSASHDEVVFPTHPADKKLRIWLERNPCPTSAPLLVEWVDGCRDALIIYHNALRGAEGHRTLLNRVRDGLQRAVRDATTEVRTWQRENQWDLLEQALEQYETELVEASRERSRKEARERLRRAERERADTEARSRRDSKELSLLNALEGHRERREVEWAEGQHQDKQQAISGLNVSQTRAGKRKIDATASDSGEDEDSVADPPAKNEKSLMELRAQRAALVRDATSSCDRCAVDFATGMLDCVMSENATKCDKCTADQQGCYFGGASLIGRTAVRRNRGLLREVVPPPAKKPRLARDVSFDRWDLQDGEEDIFSRLKKIGNAAVACEVVTARIERIRAEIHLLECESDMLDALASRLSAQYTDKAGSSGSRAVRSKK